MSPRMLTGARLEAAGVAATDDVEGLVAEIRGLYHAAGLELMIRVGRLIVERLYGGDPARWEHRGRKDTSFRKLERHPHLPFSASTLSRAVSTYLFAQRHPELPELRHVGPSHVQELFGVKENLQVHLLLEAETGGWSVQRLRQEVQAVRGEATSKGGRPRLPAFSKCLRQFRRHVDARLLLRDLEQIDALDPSELRTLLQVSQRLCQQTETLARQLATQVAKLDATRPARASHS